MDVNYCGKYFKYIKIILLTPKNYYSITRQLYPQKYLKSTLTQRVRAGKISSKYQLHCVSNISITSIMEFPSPRKESNSKAGMKETQVLSLELGRSPAGRDGNPPQYSCPGNPGDRGTESGPHFMRLQRIRHRLACTHTITSITQNN